MDNLAREFKGLGIPNGTSGYPVQRREVHPRIWNERDGHEGFPLNREDRDFALGRHRTAHKDASSYKRCRAQANRYARQL